MLFGMKVKGQETLAAKGGLENLWLVLLDG